MGESKEPDSWAEDAGQKNQIKLPVSLCQEPDVPVEHLKIEYQGIKLTMEVNEREVTQNAFR